MNKSDFHSGRSTDEQVMMDEIRGCIYKVDSGGDTSAADSSDQPLIHFHEIYTPFFDARGSRVYYRDDQGAVRTACKRPVEGAMFCVAEVKYKIKNGRICQSR